MNTCEKCGTDKNEEGACTTCSSADTVAPATDETTEAPATETPAEGDAPKEE